MRLLLRFLTLLAFALLIGCSASRVPVFTGIGVDKLFWAIRAGGENDDNVGGIASLPDKSVIITGWFKKSTIFGEGEVNETVLEGNRYDHDIFLARYNPNGSLAWAKGANGEWDDGGTGLAILSDDSIILTGWFEMDATFGKGEPNETTLLFVDWEDFFIARYYSDGTLAWVRHAGGKGHIMPHGIVALSDNSTVVTGRFSNSITFDAGVATETTLLTEGERDLFITRFDPNGVVEWVKHVGSPGAEYNGAITPLPDNSIVVTGSFEHHVIFGEGEKNETELMSWGDKDIFTARYNPDGTLAWAKHLDVWNDEYGATALPDNTIVVAGAFEDSILLGEGEPGETRLTSYGRSDLFIARYFPDGTLAWAKQIKGPGSNRYPKVTARSDNSVVVSGWFGNTAVFGDGEPNETTLESIGDYDDFLARYNQDGSLEWAMHICGPPDAFSEILILPDNSIVGAGEYIYSSKYILGCDPEQERLFPIDGNDIYFVRYYPDGTFARATRAAGIGNNYEEGITALSDSSMVVTGTFNVSITFGEGEPNETKLVSTGWREIFIARFIP